MLSSLLSSSQQHIRAASNESDDISGSGRSTPRESKEELSGDSNGGGDIMHHVDKLRAMRQQDDVVGFDCWWTALCDMPIDPRLTAGCVEPYQFHVKQHLVVV